MHYRHEEPVFARERLYQMTIMVTIADWLKVSLNMVQGKSLNSMLKLMLMIKINVKPDTIMELWACACEMRQKLEIIDFVHSGE